MEKNQERDVMPELTLKFLNQVNIFSIKRICIVLN